MIKEYIIDGFTNMAFFITILLYRYISDYEGIESFLIKFDKKNILRFFKGFILGLFMILLYAAINICFNGAKLYFQKKSLIQVIAVLSAVCFSFLWVAFFEEALFRGYIMQKLLKRYSPLKASFINSLLFGMLHYFRYSSITKFFLPGILNVTLAGMLFSYTVIASNSLMYAAGCHMAWDLSGVLLFAEPCSLCHVPLNPGLLSGSTAIPEAGFILTALIAVTCIFLSISKYFINHNYFFLKKLKNHSKNPL